MFDLTINLGNILTIGFFIGGGIAFVYTMKGDTKVTDLKYTMIVANLDDFKIEMKKLTDVVTQQAVQNKRIDYVEERQMSQGKRLDEAEKRLNLYADSPIYQRREDKREIA
jgi:hypothetical protein